MKRNRNILLCCVALAVLPGCVYTKYTGENNVSMTRISLFGNQSVGSVDLKLGKVTGYQSEQAQIAGAVVEAAVRGAVKP